MQNVVAFNTRVLKGESELQPGLFSPWPQGGTSVSAEFRGETGFAYLQDQSIHGLKYWFLVFYFLEPSC